MADFPPDHPFSGPGAAERLAQALTGGGPSSPRRQAMAALADATRQLIQELMSTGASDGELTQASGLVAEAGALLRGGPHGRPYEGFAESSMAGDTRSFIDFSPVAGPSNPLAPPLSFDVDEDVVIARGVFGDAYEGPPGCVHGGFIAAAFDEVLGFTQSLTGRPGMTGLLSVRYRKPTPLHHELRFEGRVDRVDGRKIHTVATLHAGDLLTAEADALFISVDPAVFANLMATRGRTSPP